MRVTKTTARGNTAQDAIFKYITDYTFENNIPPSIREINKTTGYGNGTIYYHLGELVRKGKLRKIMATKRGASRCYVLA